MFISKSHMIHLLLVIFILVATISTIRPLTADAQTGAGTIVKCGNIVHGNFKKPIERQNYSISMNAGDSIRVQGTPLGDTLQFVIQIIDPTADRVVGPKSDYANPQSYASHTPSTETGKLSAQQNYTIVAVNAGLLQLDDNNGQSMGVGEYTLYIGCTLRDGTVINPGDNAKPTAQAIPSNPNIGTTAFSGNGFPGLAAVDFANVAPVPLQDGANNGAVTPNGGEILGFTFDGKANGSVDLSFKRISGNLNLGIVILSPDNKVVFQTSLVTSDALSTHFTLPTAGTYTIGVFKIDLLAPDKPQATAFQIQAKSN